MEGGAAGKEVGDLCAVVGGRGNNSVINDNHVTSFISTMRSHYKATYPPSSGYLSPVCEHLRLGQNGAQMLWHANQSWDKHL